MMAGLLRTVLRLLVAMFALVFLFVALVSGTAGNIGTGTVVLTVLALIAWGCWKAWRLVGRIANRLNPPPQKSAPLVRTQWITRPRSRRGVRP